MQNSVVLREETTHVKLMYIGARESSLSSQERAAREYQGGEGCARVPREGERAAREYQERKAAVLDKLRLS